MRTFIKVRSLVAGLVIGSALMLAPDRASAEEIFPAVIAAEAGIPCTPDCTLCHSKSPGEAGTWAQKTFGTFMALHGAVKGDANSIKTAFAAYKALKDTQPTVAAGLNALQSGLDPDNGRSLCGPTYGCGAHVAKQAPPSDLSAPLWMIGAMVVGGLLRRRKR
jgi:hypothetical protein